MTKPCDVCRDLPCLSRDGDCLGPACWDHDHEAEARPVRFVRECRWVSQCRAWWRKREAARAKAREIRTKMGTLPGC